MSESLRQHYLQALGVVQYVCREALLQVDKAVLDSPLTAVAEALVSTAQDTAPQVKSDRDLATAQKPCGPVDLGEFRPSPSPRPDVDLTPQPAAAEPLHVKLALWQVDEQILICSDVSEQLPGRSEQRLLVNILRAIGCEVNRADNFELVEWPLQGNVFPHGDEQSGQDPKSEVREFVATLLQARFSARPVKQLIVLGDDALQWLPQVEHSTVANLQFLTVPSLSQMIQTPSSKADAWATLGHLAG